MHYLISKLQHMGKSEKRELVDFLTPFDQDLKEIVLWLRDFVWDLYPIANELIYDNYNALAFGWSPTDKLGHTFCSIAIGRTNKNVHFGFYWGAQISDPEKMLLGKGNQYRYILVQSKTSFPKKYIELLLKESYVNSLAKVKDPSQVREGLTITKSISGKKRELKPKSKK
jgi:hypothetical protein